MQFYRKEACTPGGMYLHDYHDEQSFQFAKNFFSWGVYGQLGHGNVEDAFQPKIVKFFEKKVNIAIESSTN